MDQNQNQNLQSLDEIQQKIAEALGVTGEPTEQQMDLIDKATDVILKKIFLSTVEKLSATDSEEYSKFLEKEASPEEIGKFLSDKIPGYNDLKQKIITDFIEEMKTAATTS